MTQDFKTTLFSIEENSRSCSEDDSETDGETGASLNQQDQQVMLSSRHFDAQDHSTPTAANCRQV